MEKGYIEGQGRMSLCHCEVTLSVNIKVIYQERKKLWLTLMFLMYTESMAPGLIAVSWLLTGKMYLLYGRACQCPNSLAFHKYQAPVIKGICI